MKIAMPARKSQMKNIVIAAVIGFMIEHRAIKPMIDKKVAI